MAEAYDSRLVELHQRPQTAESLPGTWWQVLPHTQVPYRVEGQAAGDKRFLDCSRRCLPSTPGCRVITNSGKIGRVGGAGTTISAVRGRLVQGFWMQFPADRFHQSSLEDGIPRRVLGALGFDSC